MKTEMAQNVQNLPNELSASLESKPRLMKRSGISLLFALLALVSIITFPSWRSFPEYGDITSDGGAPGFLLSGTTPAFSSQVNFFHLDRVSAEDFQGLVIHTIPVHLQTNFQAILDKVLTLSEKYKVDPFWVISVIWAESHFRIQAQSHKGASGLMQVMPATGEWLKGKLKRKLEPSMITRSLNDPELNLELGVYYLSKLKRMFRGHHRFATVSYNMGPNWVKRRLRKGRPVGNKNLYLQKVQSYYSLLTRRFVYITKANSHRRIKNNYVMQVRRQKRWDYQVGMYQAFSEYNETDSFSFLPFKLASLSL